MIIRSHPEKAPPNELSQQKAKELSQRIDDAKISWKNIRKIQMEDGMRAFPLNVDSSSSENGDLTG